MKAAHLLAVALLVAAAAIVVGATPAGAQSIPETPIGPGPHAVTPAIEPILTCGPTTQFTLLRAPAGGSFAPILPVWLPTLQWSSPRGAATRETGGNGATKERNRSGRIVSR